MSSPAETKAPAAEVADTPDNLIADAKALAARAEDLYGAIGGLWQRAFGLELEPVTEEVLGDIREAQEAADTVRWRLQNLSAAVRTWELATGRKPLPEAMRNASAMTAPCGQAHVHGPECFFGPDGTLRGFPCGQKHQHRPECWAAAPVTEGSR